MDCATRLLLARKEPLGPIAFVTIESCQSALCDYLADAYERLQHLWRSGNQAGVCFRISVLWTMGKCTLNNRVHQPTTAIVLRTNI